MRRVEAIEAGEHLESELYHAALRQFENSLAFSRLTAGVPDGEARTLLRDDKLGALETVESDRAAFREAILEDYEARWRYRRAARGLIPIVVLVFAVIYGMVATYVLRGQQAAILAGTIAVLVIGVARALIEARIAEFVEADKARRFARRDRAAAEQLLTRALVEVGLPDQMRQVNYEKRRPASPPAADPSQSPPPTLDAATADVEPLDPTDLVEVYSSRQQVATTARTRLQDLIAGLSGASLGIAGPRGIGKTSLLRWFFEQQTAESGHLALQIGAPVRYEPRDFVLTIFAQLCEEVMGAQSVPLLPRRQRFLTSSWATFAGVVLIVFGGGLYLTNLTMSGSTRDLAGIGTMLLGILVLILRFVGPARGSATGSHSLSKAMIKTGDPADVAPVLLRDIRFQLTFATGYSGKLTAGFGELGSDTSYSLAARQESFPEIVSRFQAFLEAVARQRGMVYIGIDELDKLPTADAVRFLDDVKGLFGVPGCFFLVSVSADALGQFERRGLPIRDAFDSAFDEIVRIEPLRSGESVLLLSRRVGIHHGLAHLCHILAGGIPRDVVRQARRLALATRARPTLANAATTLVLNDLRERASGVRLATTPNASSDPALSRWLDSFETAADAATLLELAAAPPAAVGYLGCLAYYGATILELVEQDEDASLMALCEEADELAEAREQIVGRPEMAWERCDQARSRHKLTALDFLAPPSAPIGEVDQARVRRAAEVSMP